MVEKAEWKEFKRITLDGKIAAVITKLEVKPRAHYSYRIVEISKQGKDRTNISVFTQGGRIQSTMGPISRLVQTVELEIDADLKLAHEVQSAASDAEKLHRTYYEKRDYAPKKKGARDAVR